MKKLKLADLVVSSFEVAAPVGSPEDVAAMDRTPDTHCFDCGSHDSFCLPGPGGL